MRRCSLEDVRRLPGNFCAAIRPIGRSVRTPIRAEIPPRAGGCTFAADPALDCARAPYLWTAEADPCVLRGRIFPAPGSFGGIDLSSIPHSIRQGAGCHHVRFDPPDGALRLDLIEGAMGPGMMTIEPAVALDRPLEPQLASIRRLDALVRGDVSPRRDQRFLRLVEALRAADALAAGASLREIGLGVMGSDWPGDGEHLKSRARRRVALAAELLRAGPPAVLSHQI